MNKIPAEKAVEELTLVLMYLTSFSEEVLPKHNIHRAWKGYDFDVLNTLKENAYIHKGSNRSKSVTLTDEGLEQAKMLLEKYQIRAFD